MAPRQSIVRDGAATIVTLSFDCDLERDYRAMPDLLDALARRELRASFACIGKWVEELPEIHRRMLDEGHEIINHSYTHPSNVHFHPTERFNALSTERREAEILQAHRVYKRVLGYDAVGFRTPHFGDSHTPDIYRILEKLGYRYSSSLVAAKTMSLGEPWRLGRVWELPMSADPNQPFSTFDTWNTFRSDPSNHTPQAEEAFFSALRWTLSTARKQRAYLSFYFDPADIRHLSGFEPFLDCLTADGLVLLPYADLLPLIEHTR